MRLLFWRVESRRASEGVDASGRGRGSRKIRQLLAIVRGGLLVAFPDQGCRKTVVGLVSVVKVAEAYSRHGDERGGLSRAIRRVAGQIKLADGCGDSDSRGGECVRGPMGHRAAMRGRRSVSGGCAWVVVGVLRCWRAVMSRWSGGVSCTADVKSERATTGMVWSREARDATERARVVVRGAVQQEQGERVLVGFGFIREAGRGLTTSVCVCLSSSSLAGWLLWLGLRCAVPECPHLLLLLLPLLLPITITITTRSPSTERCAAATDL